MSLQQPEDPWGGHPYYPISAYYKQRFGQKVYKISVSTAESCPVRLKNSGADICIFCDEWGAAASRLVEADDLETKINVSRERIAKRYKADRFLVYFQPYTSTFTRLSDLEAQIETSLAQDKVVGVVLGTRPDCLPKPIFALLRRYHEQAYISVELGVQSLRDERLEFLKRGHSAQDSIDATKRLAEESGVDVGMHLMFGLPGETDAEVIELAQRVNQLPVQNVKLHNLHVLSNTPLAELYTAGEFEPIELEPYSERVIQFLTHLSPQIAVHRLTAVASRWDELLAPQWSRHRMAPTEFILGQMREQGRRQGDAWDGI